MTADVIPLHQDQAAANLVLVDPDELARLHELEAATVAPLMELVHELARLRTLRQEVLAFAELVETRRRAGWLRVHRPTFRRVCAAADYALEEEKW